MSLTETELKNIVKTAFQEVLTSATESKALEEHLNFYLVLNDPAREALAGKTKTLLGQALDIHYVAHILLSNRCLEFEKKMDALTKRLEKLEQNQK